VKIFDLQGWKDDVLLRCIRDAAKEAGISFKQGEEIFYMTWKTAKAVMSSGTFARITIPFFGTFKPKVGVIKRYALDLNIQKINNGDRSPKLMQMHKLLRLQRVFPMVEVNEKMFVYRERAKVFEIDEAKKIIEDGQTRDPLKFNKFEK
jgi:hypothetical protein